MIFLVTNERERNNMGRNNHVIIHEQPETREQLIAKAVSLGMGTPSDSVSDDEIKRAIEANQDIDENV